MSVLTVRPVDPHDDAALRAWYDVMRAGAAAGRDAPTVYTYPSLSVSLRNPNPRRTRTPYAAFAGTELVGTLMVEGSAPDNRHLAEVDVSVPPAYRGRGYGAALLRHAERVVAADGRTTLLGEVYVPAGTAPDDWPGHRFAARHGFTVEHREDHLVLDLPDPARSAGSGQGPLRDGGSGRPRNAGTGDGPDAEAPPRVAAPAGYHVVSWVGACPDEHLDAYVGMRNAMERDVPTGEVDREPEAWDAERVRTREKRMAAQGYTILVAAGRHDTTGALAGYSELLVGEHEPGQVLQNDTLVMSHHRGHGIGAALKSGNLDVLRDRFPDRTRIHTWTAGVNAAMRHVNAAFGFRPVETLHEVEHVLP